MMYRRILVGYDGSANAHAALRTAAQMGHCLQAEVVALYVADTLPRFPETVDEVQQEREAVQVSFRSLEKRVHAVAAEFGITIPIQWLPGKPARVLLEHAERGAFQLVVVGQSGHSGLFGRFLGNTADRVSEHAHCSVLIVREYK